MGTGNSSLARWVLRRRRSVGRDAAHPMRRVPSFEHCEPRLALSGTSAVTLDLSALEIPDTSEGGYIVVANLDTSATSSYAQFFDATDIVVFRPDGTAIADDSVASLQYDSATGRVYLVQGSGQTQTVSEVTAIGGVLIGSDIMGGDIGIRPIQIPLGNQLPSEGGLVGTSPLPESGFGLPTSAGGRSQLAAVRDASQPAVDPSPDAVPRPVPPVEGLRGRAIVFDVAAQMRSVTQRPAESESVDESARTSEPVDSSVSLGWPRELAVVDAAHAVAGGTLATARGMSAGLRPGLRLVSADHGTETLGRARLAGAAPTEHATSSADAIRGAHSESPLAARDEALADDTILSPAGYVAAMLDPTRHRPILGVAAGALLLTARAFYSPKPAADRSPVEQHPRRRASKAG